MAPSGDFALIEDFLQFVGVFVSFSIAYISLRGVRQTASSSLLRLATAFAFLGFGFLVEGIVGLDALSPVFPTLATTVVVAGLLLETTGYFFLALSHAVDVMMSRRLAFALLIFPVFTLSASQLSSILGILSFYFVMYGVFETTLSYSKSRRPDTLLIAIGLALIGSGIFVQWLSLLYSGVEVLSLVQIIMKEVGLLTLFTPVLGFARRFPGVKLDGPI